MVRSNPIHNFQSIEIADPGTVTKITGRAFVAGGKPVKVHVWIVLFVNQGSPRIPRTTCYQIILFFSLYLTSKRTFLGVFIAVK